MGDEWKSVVQPQLEAIPEGWYELEVTAEALRTLPDRSQLILTFEILKHPYEGKTATGVMNVKPVITPNSKMAKWGEAIFGEKRKGYTAGDFKGAKCLGLVRTIVKPGKTTMLRVTDVRPLNVKE